MGNGEMGGTGDATGSGAVRSGAMAVVPEGGAARGATFPGAAEREPRAPFVVAPGRDGASGGIGGAGLTGAEVLGSGLTTGGG
jgi:hypothetical protein